MHAVIAGTGGIGTAIAARLLEDLRFETITLLSRTQPTTLLDPDRIDWIKTELTDQESVEASVRSIAEVDWVINTAGILHTDQSGPEKSLGQISSSWFLESMAINVLPALHLARSLQPKFRHNRPAIFAALSARVGSIGDNRLGGWYSYRASKAALNMCLKNIANEWRLKLKNTCVAAMHPGTTDTALSKPFQSNVPADKLFTPKQTAEYLYEVLSSLSPDKSGRFWAWDGSEIEW